MATTSSTQKKTASKSTTVTKKPAPKKRSAGKKKATKSATQKVDYYPNRMTLAISALAGTLIVLLALIAVLGQR